MAVHVPLSAEAQAEARFLMLAAGNLLKPSDGAPGYRADTGHGSRLLLPDADKGRASRARAKCFRDFERSFDGLRRQSG